MNSRSLDVPLFCAATILASSLLACSGDNGQVDANASFRVEFPEAVASSVEFPLLLTISLGPEGREENQGSQSAQRAVVLCQPLDPFIFRGSVRLMAANCRQEDVYARATLREIELEDSKACEGLRRCG